MRKFLAINCCIWRIPDETYFQIGGGWGGGGGGREFYRSLEAPHSILLIS